MAEDLKDVLRRAAAGETQALNTILDLSHPLIWRVLGKFSALSPSDREDLSQDVFLILLTRGLRAFHGSTAHEWRWYVKTIAENEAKSYLRQRGRRREVSDLLLQGEDDEEATRPQADPAPGPEEVAAGQEVLRGLHRCVQELSATDQEIFWMRERGRAYEEISRVLGLPLGTPGVKYSRAKAKIEECLTRAGIVAPGGKKRE